MKLIIGLGNPGTQHAHTRHNIGFLALDFLQHAFSFEAFAKNQKMLAEVSSGLLKNEKVLLVKPTTFMNESGSAVRALIQFYKLTPADIAVIHDDMDISSADLRVTRSSRAAGHNGVADIIEKLGTQDFFRIRLGIGRPTEVSGVCMPSHDFVLQNFSPEEQEKLPNLFPKVQEELFRWLALP